MVPKHTIAAMRQYKDLVTDVAQDLYDQYDYSSQAEIDEFVERDVDEGFGYLIQQQSIFTDEELVYIKMSGKDFKHDVFLEVRFLLEADL